MPTLNVGRNDESFLRHVAMHYNNLPEHVFFLKDTFAHTLLTKGIRRVEHVVIALGWVVPCVSGCFLFSAKHDTHPMASIPPLAGT